MKAKILSRAGALLAAAGLGLTLAACAEPADPGNEQPGVSVEVDKPDCEKDDWNRRETPDCGVLVGKRFYPWSWADGTRTTPPPGWSQAQEEAAIRASASPRQTAPSRTAAAPGASKTQAPAGKPAADPTKTRKKK